jgi:hypothetical protein
VNNRKFIFLFKFLYEYLFPLLEIHTNNIYIYISDLPLEKHELKKFLFETTNNNVINYYKNLYKYIKFFLNMSFFDICYKLYNLLLFFLNNLLYIITLTTTTNIVSNYFFYNFCIIFIILLFFQLIFIILYFIFWLVIFILNLIFLIILYKIIILIFEKFFFFYIIIINPPSETIFKSKLLSSLRKIRNKKKQQFFIKKYNRILRNLKFPFIFPLTLFIKIKYLNLLNIFFFFFSLGIFGFLDVIRKMFKFFLFKYLAYNRNTNLNMFIKYLDLFILLYDFLSVYFFKLFPNFIREFFFF